MRDFFQHYNFLTLSLLFTLPGMVIWLLRPDLRRIIKTVIIFALPFACTEALFYPSYWEPNFLFDLGQRIGFGIEDFVFVTALAAFASTIYAFVCNHGYTPTGKSGPFACGLRALGLFVFAGLFFLGTSIAEVAVIYTACLVMIACTCVILPLRRDLIVASLVGALLSTTLYFVLCLAAGKIMPGFFRNVWQAQNYLNIFIAGIPLEELLYGFSTGLVATVFYPYVFSMQLTPRKR